jgi:hypothetical protein
MPHLYAIWNGNPIGYIMYFPLELPINFFWNKKREFGEEYRISSIVTEEMTL